VRKWCESIKVQILAKYKRSESLLKTSSRKMDMNKEIEAVPPPFRHFSSKSRDVTLCSLGARGSSLDTAATPRVQINVRSEEPSELRPV
jgi:hypothetical protein